MTKQAKRKTLTVFISYAEIHRKFEDLEWIQRTRLQNAATSHDPNHAFATDKDPRVQDRNRYFNVQAYANHRVHLQVPEGECDFINASPITLSDSITQQEHKYIATQVGGSFLCFSCHACSGQEKLNYSVIQCWANQLE